METRNTNIIKGILFDYGGTIDTNGIDWFDLIWKNYQKMSVPINKANYLEAHRYAENEIKNQKLIKKGDNFYKVLLIKVCLQASYLIENGLISQNRTTEMLPQQLAAMCYNHAIMNIKENEKILETLFQKYKLAIISESYGNVLHTLIDFGVASYFTDIIESETNENVRYNDIIRQGVSALHLQPEEILVISNSLQTDLVPASQLGCKTAWLTPKAVSVASKRQTDFKINTLKEINKILPLN